MPLGGGGGIENCVQKWKFQGRRGAYMKFPPWWGYEFLLELHNKKINEQIINLKITQLR